MDMTKFSRAYDPEFVAVCGELCWRIRGIDNAKESHMNLSRADSDLDEQPGARAFYFVMPESTQYHGYPVNW